MNPFAKAWFWMLDYVYVGTRQVRAWLAPADPAPYRSGTAGLPPVLLLPGIYETWEFMKPVAERLHALGHPIHVVTDLGHNRATVPAAAAIVSDYLITHDLFGVMIVAHSKGGLIGKFVMMSPEAGARIARTVAIATPFAGTSLARFTVLPSLRSFRPADPVIRLLVEEEFVNARIISLFGSFDPHIPGGSELPGATNVSLPVSGHFRIMADRVLLDEVVAAVGA